MRGTTITINGQLYDARTGLPVTQIGQAGASQIDNVSRQTGKVMSDVGMRSPHQKTPQIQPSTPPTRPLQATRPAKTAHSIHSTPQRSKTLHRAALKRPEPKNQTEKTAVKRSAMIQKFSPSLKTPLAQFSPLAAQQTHAVQQPAQAVPVTTKQMKQPEQLKGSALKEKLIADKMASTMPKTERQPEASTLQRRYPRLATITSGIAALVLLGGYLTYLNLPNLSLRVAASQAGVAATYPTYQPSGYGFTGPVAYSPGEVRVNFKSNTNDFAYSVVQRESNWDSQAVRDNYVVKENKQYTTIQEGGITIYLVNNKAVWVNGGVLYSVEGNAPLSGEQIQKIASSTL